MFKAKAEHGITQTTMYDHGQSNTFNHGLAWQRWVKSSVRLR